jgi:multiple sugar transport system substrate-binding protein
VLETFAVNNGGEGVFSQDGRHFTLSQMQEAAAVDWLASLVHVHKVAPSPTAPGAEDPRQMFADGRVAMLFDSSGLISKLRPVKFDFEWDIAAVPARRRRGTLGRIPMLGIATKAKYPAAAWTFLSYFWTDPAQRVLAKQACLAPVRRDRLALMSTGGGIPRSIGLLPQAMDSLILPAYTPYTERATRVFRGLLQYVWSGERSAYEVLGAVKDEVEEALAP